MSGASMALAAYIHFSPTASKLSSKTFPARDADSDSICRYQSRRVRKEQLDDGIGRTFVSALQRAAIPSHEGHRSTGKALSG